MYSILYRIVWSAWLLEGRGGHTPASTFSVQRELQLWGVLIGCCSERGRGLVCKKGLRSIFFFLKSLGKEKEYAAESVLIHIRCLNV